MFGSDESLPLPGPEAAPEVFDAALSAWDPLLIAMYWDTILSDRQKALH